MHYCWHFGFVDLNHPDSQFYLRSGGIYHNYIPKLNAAEETMPFHEIPHPAPAVRLHLCVTRQSSSQRIQLRAESNDYMKVELSVWITQNGSTAFISKLQHSGNFLFEKRASPEHFPVQTVQELQKPRPAFFSKTTGWPWVSLELGARINEWINH